MLRITVENGSKPTTLKVEGKLKGPWVDEMEQAWSSLVDKAPANSVIVDLSGVSFVDSEGRRLLERMHREGADLKAAHLTTKHIVEEVTRNENGNAEEE